MAERMAEHIFQIFGFLSPLKLLRGWREVTDWSQSGAIRMALSHV
jgi:hypothetical protein